MSKSIFDSIQSSLTIKHSHHHHYGHSVHDECKPLSGLDADRLKRYGSIAETTKALFQALKNRDFEYASLMLDAGGVELDKCFEIERDRYRTSFSLLVQVTCEARLRQNHKVIGYLVPYRLIDRFIREGADLTCRCSNKFEHRCPLFVALKSLGIKSEDEIMEEKNQIVQKLIVNGATLRKHINPHSSSIGIPDFDIEKVRSYLVMKHNPSSVMAASLQSFPRNTAHTMS